MRHLLIVAMLSGCAAPRVQLPPLPRKDAPFQEREKFYVELTPVSAERVVTTPYAYGWGGASSHVESMKLKGGWTVHHAEDLLHLLPPDSRSARFARDAADGRAAARNILLVGGGVAAAGAGLLAVGLALPRPEFAPPGPGPIGIGTMLVGLLILALWAPVNTAAKNDQSEAFRTFREGLAQSLDLQVEGPAPPPNKKR